MTQELLDTMPDPDMVGTSEYALLHAHLGDVLFSARHAGEDELTAARATLTTLREELARFAQVFAEVIEPSESHCYTAGELRTALAGVADAEPVVQLVMSREDTQWYGGILDDAQWRRCVEFFEEELREPSDLADVFYGLFSVCVDSAREEDPRLRGSSNGG